MRSTAQLVLAALILVATSASAQAQVIGTFHWQLQPYGSVLNLTITQKGNLFVLEGLESQCGNNLSLPVTGIAIPQANGTIFFGVTSINENGRGLHTRAYMNTSNFGGTWSDNAGNTNQPFVLVSSQPPPTCIGGPRTGPTSGDAGAPTGAGSTSALMAELDALRARLAALEAKKQ
ncbi:MAG TPA: hypothetical protein VMW48_05180 [Vicinamibacterales bacterium]|nr:hypothetical protein [Vicinamibacterales bacterium]